VALPQAQKPANYVNNTANSAICPKTPVFAERGNSPEKD
jgi:hypothetical protein